MGTAPDVRIIGAALVMAVLVACARHSVYPAPTAIQFACSNGHRVDRGDVDRLLDAIHGIENAPSYGVNDPDYPQKYFGPARDGVIARYADLHLPATLADGTYGLVDGRILHVGGIFSSSDQRYDRELMLYVTHIRAKRPGGRPYSMWVYFDVRPTFDICGKTPWTKIEMHTVNATH